MSKQEPKSKTRDIMNTACLEKIAPIRLFKITKNKCRICLKNSSVLIDGKVSTEAFNSEIYRVTFAVETNEVKKVYDLFFTPNELISDEEISELKDYLGIQIAGVGSCFEIVDYTNSFTIQFDQENSLFVDNAEVANGCLYFTKE